MLRVLSSEIDLYPGSQEERLPGFSAQFPHITSYALLPDDPAQGCIWHWHKSLELFRVEQGALLYHTPGGQRLFRQRFGCSPSAYRAKWQDPDTQRQKDDSLPAASGAILKP